MLDEASAAQLIRPNQADSFTFTYDKICETLYQGLNPIRRRRLHRRIGEALGRLYASGHDHAHVLAFHAVADQDWQRGLSSSLRAAEQARRIFANDEALNQPEQLATIAELVGDAYAVRGPSQQAVEHY